MIRVADAPGNMPIHMKVPPGVSGIIEIEYEPGSSMRLFYTGAGMYEHVREGGAPCNEPLATIEDLSSHTCDA
jgi:hypothetical protein